MSERIVVADDLLGRLVQAGRLDDEGAKAAFAHLAEERKTAGDPVYIRILAAVGAWAAAICFISFLTLVELLDEDGASPLIWGVILLISAVGLRRVSAKVFVTQTALAFISAGHSLLIFYSYQTFKSFNAVVITQAAVTALLYVPYSDRVYRFLATLTSLILAAAWILFIKDKAWFWYLEYGLPSLSLPLMEKYSLVHLLIGLEALTTGLILAGRRGGDLLKPLAYAAAAAAPGTISIYTLSPDITVDWRLSQLLLGGGLIWLYTWAGGGRACFRTEWMKVAVAATLVLAVIANPGLLAALGLLVLGYALGDKALLGLGFLFLPTFIVIYYYDLDVSLAYKSWVLAGSGLVLLIIRWYLGRRPWVREEAS